MNLNSYYVIIPAYEPDEKMLGIIDDIKAQTDYKIIVVNDGSSKDKDDIFAKAAEKATILVHNVNKGKGRGIKTALKYIKFNVDERVGIIIADSDGQHKIKDIIRVAQTLDNEQDKLIMGCRVFSGDIPARSKFGNNITKFVFSFAAGVKVSDTQTGLRGFTSDMIDFMLGVRGERYEFEMNMLLECAKDNISFFEVPIETVYIQGNESSHFNPIKDSWRIYRDILKFSCSSLLSFLIDYVFYTIFNLISGNLIFSNIAARVISSCCNFAMNRQFVFKHKESISKAAIKYFGLAACILVANTILLKLIVTFILPNKFISKIIVEILLFCISWIVQKKFVFKKEQRTNEQ